VDPIWTKEACQKFAPFEAFSSVAVLAVCETIMILRVYAMYNRNTVILIFLAILWIGQITISCYGLSSGTALDLPPGLVGCIFTGTGSLFPTFWVMPLGTDLFVFLFTLWRTREYIQNTMRTLTMHIILRDGIMYFLVIFVANLTNTLIFFITPAEDLKPIGACFCQLLTSTMISRLCLNLRVNPHNPSSDMFSRFSILQFAGPMNYSAFMTMAIGNLGEELEGDSTTDRAADVSQADIALQPLNAGYVEQDVNKVHVSV